MKRLTCQFLDRETKQQAEKLREQLQASEMHIAKLKDENAALRERLQELEQPLPDPQPELSSRLSGTCCDCDS